MGQMGILTYAVIKRRKNAADGSAIDTAVSMAADPTIHRTGVEAGAAADTLQAFTKRRRQNLRAAVVENDQMKLLRTIQFSLTSFASEDGGINAQRLPRGAARQQFQEYRQILEARYDLFHAHDGDVHARAGC